MNRYDLTVLKANTSILDLARDLGMLVKGNRTTCIHAENHANHDAHPSMLLYARSNRYFCPVCGSKGDVIKLVEELQGKGCAEAIRFLAQRCGLAPMSEGTKFPLKAQPKTAPKPPDDGAEFADVYQCFLDLCSPPTKEALEYLQTRGISAKTADYHGVRYVRNRRAVQEALTTKFAIEKLRASGVLNIRDRLFCLSHPLIWVFNQDGKPVYFQGRSLDPNRQPKEICLARSKPPLYNIDILKQNPKTVCVCEGTIDTITLTERGIAAVGVVGVHGFRDEFISMFSGFRVKIAFDPDLPGQTAGKELLQKFNNHGIEAEKIYLPEGYDVNLYFRTLKQFSS